MISNHGTPSIVWWPSAAAVHCVATTSPARAIPNTRAIWPIKTPVDNLVTPGLKDREAQPVTQRLCLRNIRTTCREFRAENRAREPSTEGYVGLDRAR